MKISMIGPVYPYRGGISHFTTMLAKRLMAAGHDLQVISFKKQYPAWLYPGKSDKDFSPSRKKVEAEYLLSPLNPVSWYKTAKAIVDYKPQQVIFPWWVTFWGPAFHRIISRLKKRNFPITILIHNTMPHEARPWDRFLARRTLQGGDRFIVMTEKEKGRLRALLPEKKQIIVVPHPICRVFKPSHLAKHEIKSQLGLPINRKYILFFGFVRPYKGLSDLLQAIKLIISKGIDINLIIAGEFWENKKLYEEEIRDLDIQGNVFIFDTYIPDEQGALFFEVSDIFVAPYSSGTQSGALKTALGFGLPAVVTDVITDKFILSYPERIVIVPVGEVDKLAAGLEKQLNLPPQKQAEIDELIKISWLEILAVIV